VPGNHDYLTRGAASYFGYFSAAAGTPGEGWYSYDVGTWHFAALNSNCGAIGGCGPDSPEGRWLHDDLVSHPNRCTLAYWHHPRVSSGPHGDNLSVAPLWQTAFDFGVDLVVAGHDHDYERFAPLDADAQPDPDGMVSFVVGTRGASAYTLRTPRHADSAFSAQRVYGVAELTLEPTGYQERFVAVPDGHLVDDFSGSCR
jgi:hypothetical protein